MKRLTAMLIAVVMILGISSALAAGWTCPNCGQKGNSGAFCPSCGAAKPGSTNLKAGNRTTTGETVRKKSAGSFWTSRAANCSC